MPDLTVLIWHSVVRLELVVSASVASLCGHALVTAVLVLFVFSVIHVLTVLHLNEDTPCVQG